MASNEMSLEKLFLILRTHARLIISIFTLAVAIACIITYVTPKMYTATASMNFDIAATNPVDNRGRAVYSEATYITTQIGIIQSQNVAREVEDGLTPYERDRLVAALDAKHSILDDLKSMIKSPLRAFFKGEKKPIREASHGEALDIKSAYSWLARSIGYDLSVEPMFNSRIIEVSYASTDRQIAALMANKISEAYIKTNLQMVIDPARKSKVWFDEQLKSLRKMLEDTQSKLTAYQQKEGIVSSDERLDTENSRLKDLSGQLVAAQQTTRNAVTARQKLEEVLDSGAPLTTFGPVFSNSVVQHIKSEIRGLQGQLVQNSNSLGKNHPKMKKLNSELSAARARLDSEIQTITGGISNAADLSGERERDLELALEAQKQLVLDLKNQHDRIAVLKREVETAQATYNAALTQLNTSSMQSMVDQTNVSIVDRANIPGRHSSPDAVKNIVFGVMGGLVLGIGLAVLMEIFSRRVHSREDFAVELGVPLLGHLKKV
jgi:uncharacterized protein involved in exopolysaccharide biosynthesis